MATRSLASVDVGVSLEQAELVARCLHGDRDAQRCFYERYARFVLRTARRLGTPPEELEDVAQEVFTIAFRKMDRFHEGQLSTWLYRICSNRVQHHHRSRRVRAAFARVLGHDPNAAMNVQEETQERALSRHEAERQFSEILGLMAPKKREVLVLFEIEALSGEAIAERVGCPLETVWTRLYHARREFARLARRRALREARRIGP
jgi:RNA polymerase sigma-70 factor (ECF subfamily)